MTRKLVAYLAQPVSAPAPEGIAANLANARAWLRWLVDTKEYLAVSAPWMPYVETLDEDRYRDRGLEDDLAMLARHDLVILVGGRISSGMNVEAVHARTLGIPVIDCTRMGVSPPSLPWNAACSREETARHHLLDELIGAEVNRYLAHEAQEATRRG